MSPARQARSERPGRPERARSSLRVDCLLRPGARGPAAADYAALLRGAAKRLGGVRGEVTLLVCDDEEIGGLNRTHRKKKGPTDVLSFPAGASGEEPGGPLGDIAISWRTAEAQARAAGRTLDREMKTLAVHGFLHLLGYDHENDDGEMLRLQARLLAGGGSKTARGVTNGARATAKPAPAARAAKRRPRSLRASVAPARRKRAAGAGRRRP